MSAVPLTAPPGEFAERVRGVETVGDGGRPGAHSGYRPATNQAFGFRAGRPSGLQVPTDPSVRRAEDVASQYYPELTFESS